MFRLLFLLIFLSPIHSSYFDILLKPCLLLLPSESLEISFFKNCSNQCEVGKPAQITLCTLLCQIGSRDYKENNNCASVVEKIKKNQIDDASVVLPSFNSVFSAVYGYCHLLFETGLVHEEVMECYSMLLKYRPHSPRILVDMAFYYGTNGAPKVGETMALRAIDISFELAKIYRINSSVSFNAPLSQIPSHEISAALPSHYSFLISSSELLKDISISEIYLDFNVSNFEEFMDQAHYSFALNLFEQNKWIELLSFCLKQIERSSEGLDVVYFPYLLQAAQQTVDMIVLQKFEKVGFNLMKFYTSSEEINIHPFASLSWGFMTDELLMRVSNRVTQHYLQKCTLKNEWGLNSVLRKNLIRSISRNKSTRRLRIGYVGSHFRLNHPIGNLCRSLFSSHDREKFEIFCYATLRASNPELERIFHSHCEHFYSCYTPLNPSDSNSSQICAGSSDSLEKQIITDEIQILVDLDGYMELRNNRMLALCTQPAPILINYLGFPGTMTNRFIQYLIGDAVIIPKRYAKYYFETIIHLPFSYFPTSYREVHPKEVRLTENLHFQAWNSSFGNYSEYDKLVKLREEFNLPTDKFLFVTFNAMSKLGPHFLETVVEILNGAPHSMLVLLDTDSSDKNKKRDPLSQLIKRNILSFARTHGLIDRILFLPRLSLEVHLRRLAAFDLMLDSFPYNAHTTTSDALWAGLPVLTFPQTRMSGRVAASQLFATSCLSVVSQIWDPEIIDDSDHWGDDQIEIYRVHDSFKNSWVNLKIAELEQELLIHPVSSYQSLLENRELLLQELKIQAERLFVKDSIKNSTIYESKSAFFYFKDEKLPVHVVDFSKSFLRPNGLLTTSSRRHYIDMAIYLSYSSKSRMSWRSCFERSRWSSPLFDYNRYVKDVEMSYSLIWKKYMDDGTSFQSTVKIRSEGSVLPLEFLERPADKINQIIRAANMVGEIQSFDKYEKYSILYSARKEVILTSVLVLFYPKNQYCFRIMEAIVYLPKFILEMFSLWANENVSITISYCLIDSSTSEFISVSTVIKKHLSKYFPIGFAFENLSFISSSNQSGVFDLTMMYICDNMSDITTLPMDNMANKLFTQFSRYLLMIVFQNPVDTSRTSDFVVKSSFSLIPDNLIAKINVSQHIILFSKP